MRIKGTGFSLPPCPQISGKQNTVQTAATVKSSRSAMVKTDRIELSGPSAEPAGGFLACLKDSLCEEVGKDASPARLKELKSAVEGGTYSVDSGTLAGIILTDQWINTER